MANQFLTVNKIAERALATLYETTLLPQLMYTDLSSEFGPQAQGNTINVRKPATFVANIFDRSVGIVPQDVAEGSIPVKLDTIPDVSFRVTDEDMRLSINDFDGQLLTPAMEAIAQHLDIALIRNAQNTVSQTAGSDAATSWDKPEVLIEAKRKLDLKSVPQAGRFALIGPTTTSKWLNTETLKPADRSGTTEALRDASLGNRLFGFAPYQSVNVGQPSANPAVGAPTTEVGVAFHRDAFAFVSANLEIPPRASEATSMAVVRYKGISIRVTYGYDQKYKQTIVSLDMLYGFKTLDPNRAVLLKGADKA